jgi:hypothetical protein
MLHHDHSHYSSLREKVLEHLLVGELLRELWVQERRLVEVLKPEVDRGGYDLAIQLGGVIRHIQLKSSHKPKSVSISTELAGKPSGCVVLVRFDASSLALQEYLWFGGEPGNSLPDISAFKVALRTTKGRGGQQVLRQGMRVVPLRQFQKLGTIGELLEKLFG